jgi:hypothetical protein
MERSPAIGPVGCDVVLAGRTEGARDAGAGVRVGVRGELELRSALTLLKPLGDELDHPCARFLRQRERHAHGYAPQAAQRNALFSFSKKPSSDR